MADNIIDQIENSSVIQYYKQQYETAKANNDTAGMAAAHEAANNYRETYGGYTDTYTEGGGTSFTREVTNSSLFQSANEAISQLVSNNSSSDDDSSSQIVYIKDNSSSDSSSSISSSLSSVLSNGTINNYLGYALVALLFVGIISKLFRR